VFGGKYASGAQQAYDAQASNVMTSGEESKNGDVTDPMFALVMLQNYELQGTTCFDRFAFGPVNFCLTPYLLPRAVAISQNMNLKVTNLMQEMGAQNDLLQQLQAQRPPGPFSADQSVVDKLQAVVEKGKDAESGSDGQLELVPMMEWAAKRKAAVGRVLTLFADLTIAVAEEMVQRGGEHGRNEGLLLLKVAVELFRIDGAALEGIEVDASAGAFDASSKAGAAKQQLEMTVEPPNVICGR
jgi:hypothetical protein